MVSDETNGPARIHDRVAPIYALYSGPMEWMGGARRRRRLLGQVQGTVLEVADIEDLPYDNDRFDTVAATCVFCSVADPVRGLRELARVTKPDGRVLLLEHVRARHRRRHLATGRRRSS